jgi:hypothetical protein
MRKMEQQNQVDVLKYLHHQIAGEKRFNPSRSTCFIKSVVPQGDNLYAIARYKDKTITNPDGTLQNVPGGYVGNEAKVPEDKLIISEILIPTNIDLALLRGANLQALIGLQAEVEMIDSHPNKIIIDRNVFQPRTIPREVIVSARSNSPTQDLDKLADQLIEQNGYPKVVFGNLKKELVSQINPDGYVLVYGDTADWSRQSTEDSSKDGSYKDISKTVDIANVTGLPAAKLSINVCFRIPTFFSGF